MESSISAVEITADVLSAKTLALVSEFALVLYRTNGIIIDVHSNDVIYRVFESASNATEPRLKEISEAISAEIAKETESTHCANQSQQEETTKRLRI